MMHPDHFALIIKIMRVALMIFIAIYAFKLGRTVYWMISQPT
jgi:hypothetical protein